MFLSEILNLVIRRLPYSFGVFLLTFLIISNSGLLKDKYIMERNVVIGTHLGSSNFPMASNFINIVNSAEFKSKLKLKDVATNFEPRDASLIVTFKGDIEENLIAASKLWISAINEIEEKLWKEKSIEILNNNILKLKEEIEFYENFNPKFSSEQTLEELALVNMLNDKFAVNNWAALNSAKFKLRGEMLKEAYLPTKFFLEGDGKVIRYFPNRMSYIGVSLIVFIFYNLLIIGLHYRRKS